MFARAGCGCISCTQCIAGCGCISCIQCMPSSNPAATQPNTAAAVIPPLLACSPVLQGGQLPALQRLRPERCSFSAGSMDGLSSLSGSLTYLRVAHGPLTPSLSALTGLRHLDLGKAELAEGGQRTWTVR